MSTAIAKDLMAEIKFLGMFAAFDQGVSDAIGSTVRLGRNALRPAFGYKTTTSG